MVYRGWLQLCDLMEGGLAMSRRGARSKHSHRRRTLFFPPLHAVPHQLNLHLETVNFVGLVRDSLYLANEYLEISSIVSAFTGASWSRTEL